MRAAVVEYLMNAARLDKDIWFLTGDLGYSYVEAFEEVYPNRFINVGVAEQNLMSIAAGLALLGKKVFVYSIVNFCTFRCLEQIRNDICYHNLDVTIIGVGTGYAYGSMGYSHHGVEDIGVMRTLPFLKVFSPSNNHEAKAVMRHIEKSKGPCYLRLDKDRKMVSDQYPVLPNILEPIEIYRGKDVCLVSHGSCVSICMEVAKLLKQKDLSVSVYSMPLVHPISEKSLHDFSKSHALFVIEEHTRGGLGTSLLEAKVFNLVPIFEVFFVEENPIYHSADQGEFQRYHRLDPNSIGDRILNILKERYCIS